VKSSINARQEKAMRNSIHLLFLCGILCLLVSGCGHTSESSSATAGGGSTGTGTINGTVWKDLNRDKAINPGEPGIPDISVDLFRDSNGNGAPDSTDQLVATTTTDSRGNYSFTVTSAGRYFVSVNETPLSGLTLTTNNDYPAFEFPSLSPTATLRVDVTDPNGSIQNLNFGFFSPVKWSSDISKNAVVLQGNVTPCPFVSSPALASDGTIYIGSGNDTLFAVNPDGTLKWQYATGASLAASPAIGSDGTIYEGSVDRQFYAINPDGTLKWIVPTKTVFTSSAAIGADGTIYVAGTNLDQTILCINTASPVTVQLGELYAINPDGTIKWMVPLSGPVHSSPAVSTDGTIYVGSEGDFGADRSDPCDPKSPYPPSDVYSGFPVNGHFYAVNPDGSLKWDIKMTGDVDSSPSIAPDGTVYVGSHYPTKAYGTDTSTLATVGSETTGYLNAINPDGTIKWFVDLFGAVDSSAAIGSDGTIYVGSDDFHVWALNPVDGSKKWVFPTRDKVKSSPAIAVDGTIYVGSNDGSLYALNPDGTLKSRIIASDTELVNSAPTIAADGTVYFATGAGSGKEKIYSVIGNSPLADTPWPRFHHDTIDTGRQ
jgi:outer membrane protein assembly factor BamB